MQSFLKSGTISQNNKVESLFFLLIYFLGVGVKFLVITTKVKRETLYIKDSFQRKCMQLSIDFKLIGQSSILALLGLSERYLP